MAISEQQQQQQHISDINVIVIIINSLLQLSSIHLAIIIAVQYTDVTKPRKIRIRRMRISQHKSIRMQMRI